MSFDTPEQSALSEVGNLLQDLKENNPTAFDAFKSQITNLAHTVSEASGIGPGIKRIQSSFLAPQRAYSELLFNQLEKALGPLTNDMRYFLTNVSMEIEDFMLDNVIGAGIGGLIGALLGSLIGHPVLGAMGGAGIGAGIQAAATSGGLPDVIRMSGFGGGGGAWIIPSPYSGAGDDVAGRSHNRELPPLVYNSNPDLTLYERLRAGGQLSSISKTMIAKYRLHNLIM